MFNIYIHRHIIDKSKHWKWLLIEKTYTFYWEMSYRTFTARAVSAGFRFSEDGLTLFLGAHAARDSKLKTMLIYYSENPSAFKNYVVSTLPVL